jgi:hypothetical protein
VRGALRWQVNNVSQHFLPGQQDSFLVAIAETTLELNILNCKERLKKIP